MNTLRQSPEKMRAMREALKRSTNPPADAMMYAEFAALPLNLFQRVCSFAERDWFMFGACREGELEMCDEESPAPLPLENFVGTQRLDYDLYVAMRTCLADNRNSDDKDSNDDSDSEDEAAHERERQHARDYDSTYTSDDE